MVKKVTKEKLSDKANANHGLVFIFIPLEDNYGSYAQPIGVFASKGTTKDVVGTNSVMKAITVLEKAGAFIHGIICDGAAPNQKFWNEMGVSRKLNEVKNWFEALSTQQLKTVKYLCSLIHQIFLRISEIGSIIIKSSRFVILLIYFSRYLVFIIIYLTIYLKMTVV